MYFECKVSLWHKSSQEVAYAKKVVLLSDNLVDDSKCRLEEGVCHFISMKSKNSSFKCLIEGTRGLALLFKKIIVFLICDFSPEDGENRRQQKHQ